MHEQLSAARLTTGKSEVLRMLVSEVDETRFTVTGCVAGSSTSEMFRGTINNGDGQISCVLKIPSQVVAGSDFFQFVYGSAEGVRRALSAAFEQVSQPQPLSPEIALVYVKRDANGSMTLAEAPGTDSQIGLLMLEIPLDQWLDQRIESIVDSPNWQPILEHLLQKAIDVLFTLLTPADNALAQMSHPELIAEWPVINGFERILRLSESLEKLADLAANIRDFSIDTYLSEDNVGYAQLLRDTFQQLVQANSVLLTERLAHGCIGHLHGDSKIQNWIIISDEDGTEHVVAVDGLRFFDIESDECRPWHIRDRQWDVALLLVTAAIKILQSKDTATSLAFIQSLESRAVAQGNDKNSEQVAFSVYALYAFYVQADTLLRIALSSLTANCYDEARFYFSEVSRILELGAAYARQVVASSTELK